MNRLTASDAARAARWVRAIRALRTPELRQAYLTNEINALNLPDAGNTLELLCSQAEQGVEGPVVALHAIVDVFVAPRLEMRREALRQLARTTGLASLARLLRRPFSISTPPLESANDVLLPAHRERPSAEVERDLPDYGRGRPLTLGERKAIARRPPPELLPRVLLDPHVDVIRRVLGTPRLTEDDVVRLATRRSARGEILTEIARHPRWIHRPRIRQALVLNPATPVDVTLTLVALLRRAELALVARTPGLHPAVRAVALERFDERPPTAKRHGVPGSERRGP